MLQSIRDKATGWLAYVIIGLIAIPFALWGLGEYFGGAGPLVAAEVNGYEIPVRQVQQEVRIQREEIARMLGGSIPPNLIDDAALREAALQSIIHRVLLLQTAEKQGLRASPQGVIAEIQSVAAFAENGRFSPERYYSILQAQRIAPGDFERDISQSIILAQAQQRIAASGYLPLIDREEYARLRNQLRVASWRIFDPTDYAVPEIVDMASVEAFYQEHSERFTTPEKVQIRFLRLDPERLETQVDLAEDEIRQHYEMNAIRFEEPELRNVRQLFLSMDSVSAEEDIHQLRRRIDQGEDFALLAREYSQDRLSAQQGGSLGLIERGDLDTILETVIFSLPQGLVSQPVRTRLGWHIVEVTEIQASRRVPFEQVRAEVENDLRDRRAEQRQIQILDALLSQTFENPDQLEAAASATGLRIETSDWFSRLEGEGVAMHRAVREAAFSPNVLVHGRNSDAIDLPDGSTLILRVDSRRPPQVLALAEVEEEIRASLQEQASIAAARSEGDSVLALLENNMQWTEVIEENPAAWVRSVAIHRVLGAETEVHLPSALQRQIFRMRAPGEDQPLIQGWELPDGKYAVVVLESVEMVALEETSLELAQAADELQTAYAESEFLAYLNWLEDQAKIRMYPQNLD